MTLLMWSTLFEDYIARRFITSLAITCLTTYHISTFITALD